MHILGLVVIKKLGLHVTFRLPKFKQNQPTGHFHHDALAVTLSINKISYIRMEGIQTICMIAQKIKTAIWPINHLGSHQGTSILKSDNTIMGQHLQIKGIRTTPIDSLLRHIQ